MNSTSGNNSKMFEGRIPLFGVIVLIVVIAGLAFDVTKADNDTFYKDTQRFDQVFLNIHQKYVENIDSKKLIDSAIGGMLRILDPHSNYFEKKQYEELIIQTEGKFGGLGIQIAIRDKVLTVMTPIPGTPAERAGIQSGDQILKINGKSTEGITIDEAVSKLRGAPDTDVSITIRRRGESKDLDYKITRAIIQIKPVPFCGVFGDGIGYLVLKTFSQDAGSEVEKALRELLKHNIKGIVFDLRFNPGGLLPQAIEVAEKFLPRNSLVVYTRGRVQAQNAQYYANSDPVLPPEIPLVVLVNGASASASEIVAGAIQDWDRGLILGDTTFGKGSVQTILQVDEANHLKLTTAYYYTPSGRCINKPENAVRSGKKSGDDDENGEGAEKDSAAADSSAMKAKSKAGKDTTAYKTKNQRIVYGGGGIIPDTIIEYKLPGYVIRSLLIKDAFFSFATLEYPKLQAKHVKVDEKFIVSDAMLKDFYHYLDSVEIGRASCRERVYVQV
jgi:carboxyl-terminal processing protease